MSVSPFVVSLITDYVYIVMYEMSERNTKDSKRSRDDCVTLSQGYELFARKVKKSEESFE